MIAVVALTVLALALLGALIYLQLAHARERQALLDRIQAPQAAQAGATERLIPQHEPKPEPPPYYVPVTDPDLAFLGNQ